MKLKVEGSILLSKIDKEHAIYLISNFNEEQIANMYDVSVRTVRSRMAEKMNEFMIPTALKNHMLLKKPDDVKFEKKAFSENEEDYGFENKNIKHIVTKNGLFVFEGNAPIEDPGITPLAKIVQIYKQEISYEERVIETDGSI